MYNGNILVWLSLYAESYFKDSKLSLYSGIIHIVKNKIKDVN